MQEKYQQFLSWKDDCEKRWAKVEPADKEFVYGTIALMPTIAFAAVAIALANDIQLIEEIRNPLFNDFFNALYQNMHTGEAISATCSGLSGIISLGFFGSSKYHRYKQPSSQPDLDESLKLTNNLPV